MIRSSLHNRIAAVLRHARLIPWVVAALGTIIALGALCTQARAQLIPGPAEQQRIVASVIAAEAAGQGPHGMYLVACVIANRARYTKSTPYQVVTAKGQFNGYKAANRAALYAQVQPWADWLSKNCMGLYDYTSGAIFFASDAKHRWYYGVMTVHYKKHRFYRQNGAERR